MVESEDSKQTDPWQTRSSVSEEATDKTKKFEDNFTPLDESDKLPDSAEYLAKLEKKLARIKSGKGNEKTEGKELLKSLQETRESCMHRLTSGNEQSSTNEDLYMVVTLPNSVKIKCLLKGLRITQSITVEELAGLLDTDQFEIVEDSNN